MGGEKPSLEAILIVLAEQCGRSAQSTRIGKRVIHLTALKECDVIGACNLIEAIERLEIADADQNILVLICPTREDIAKSNVAIGEVSLNFIAKAARHGALSTKTHPANTTIKPKVTVR